MTFIEHITNIMKQIRVSRRIRSSFCRPSEAYVSSIIDAMRRQTHAIHFSTSAFLHVPVDPVKAISCVSLSTEKSVHSVHRSKAYGPLLTPRLLVDTLSLAHIYFYQERGKICPAPSLTRLQELACTLKEDIDGGVVLCGFDITRRECTCFLVCFICVTLLDLRQDGC